MASPLPFLFQSPSVYSPLANIFPVPIIAKRAPTANDINYPIGQEWVYPATNSVYFLTSVVANSATWQDVAGGAGVFTSLTVNPGPTNLSTVGNGNVTVGNAANTGAITFNTGTGNFVLNGNGNTVDIASDAHANTLVMGTTTAGATTEILGGNGTGIGTASVAVVSAAAGDIQIGDINQTGVLYLGNSTTTGTITVGGTGGGTGTISLAVGTGNRTVNIGTGTGITGVAIGTSAHAHTVTVGSTSAGSIEFITGPGNFTVNGSGNSISIGSDAAANTVFLGSTTGAASTTIEAGTGGLIFTPTSGNASLAPAVVSGASTTPTLNSRVGRVTVTGLTTASAGTQTITIANTTVAASSAMFVSIYNLDASGNHAGIALYKTVVAANSIAVTYINNGAGALGAGDNVVITFWVLN